MSSRVKPVSKSEFNFILKAAQSIHKEKDEPIPDISRDNQNKLDSALNAPFQTAFGRHCYVGFINKATALFYFLAKGHPLANGNKRMACLVVAYFCLINGRLLKASDEQLIELARYTASSDAQDMEGCFRQVKKTLRKIAVPMSDETVLAFLNSMPNH